jgi:hypothetical protein
MLKSIKISLIFITCVLLVVTIPYLGWIYSGVFNNATDDPRYNLGLVPGEKYEVVKDLFIYSYGDNLSLRPESSDISISEWLGNFEGYNEQEYSHIAGIMPQGTILTYKNAVKNHLWNGGMTVSFYVTAGTNEKEVTYSIGYLLGEDNKSNEFIKKI